MNLSDYRILIVDDENLLRDVLVYDLSRRGFQTTEADNIKTALEIIKTSKIDIVLTDIRMPAGSGIDLLDQIKNEALNFTPVIILMTGDTVMTIDEAKDIGAAALFLKPFDRKELYETIFKLLQQK